jgi:hypothetical protein
MTVERLKEITDKSRSSWKTLEIQFGADNFSPDINEALLSVYSEREDLLAYCRKLSEKIGQLEKVKRHVDDGYMCAMCKAEENDRPDKSPKPADFEWLASRFEAVK